jgi:hypothetical protein
VLADGNDANGLSIVNLAYIQPSVGAAGTPDQVLGINSSGQMSWIDQSSSSTSNLFDVLTNGNDAG